MPRIGHARWYGTDFNPAQTAFAQELAEVSGNGPCCRNSRSRIFAPAATCRTSTTSPCTASELDLAGKPARIADFLARKLKPGGVLYISYNTQAGWAAMTRCAT
jgi:hypothetical protein